MNEHDDQRPGRGRLVFCSVPGVSGLLAARGHRIGATSTCVASWRSHHARSAIGTWWSVAARFPWQMDIFVGLRHGSREEGSQNKCQSEQEPHLLLLCCPTSAKYSHIEIRTTEEFDREKRLAGRSDDELVYLRQVIRARYASSRIRTRFSLSMERAALE